MKSEYSGSKRYRIPRGKRNIFKLLSATLLLILSIEAVRILFGFLTAKPVIAQWGVIEKGCWVEALFLREETLLVSESEGSLKQKVENGDRVPRGMVIAQINTGFGLATEPDPKTLRLERRLFALLSEDEALNSELKRVNAEIANRNQMLNQIPSKAGEVKEDLGSLEQEKEQILRNIKSVREKIIKTRVAIKEGMREFQSITAPNTGYIYFNYDNWEGQLTPGCFSGLSDEIFKNNINLKTVGSRVKPGDAIGKLISPFDQIIAVKADTTIIGTPAKGDSWWFKTSDGLHKVAVKDIISLTNQEVLLAFEDPGISQLYMPHRRGKIFAIYRKVNGVTIPSQALIKKEGRTFVKQPKGDGYILQEVQVLETDGTKAVIKGIDFGTTIMSR